MTKLEHSFDVEAPLDRVWETLIAIERVAPCLPGAEITDSGDGVYEGSFTIKLGPTTAAYSGKLELTEVDNVAHVVTMSANGRDKRGQGSAKAIITSSMSESAGSTHVDVVTDFSLTGKLARFGRGGMIKDVSNRLVGDFVECLRGSLEAEPESQPEPSAGASTGVEPAARSAPPPVPAKPISGGRLFLGVIYARIAGLFGRPGRL